MARDLKQPAFTFVRGVELKDLIGQNWERHNYIDRITGETRESVAIKNGNVWIIPMKTGTKIELVENEPEIPTKTAKRAQ